MGTISRANASASLTASGTATGTNVAGSVTIGETVSQKFTDADIAYSFKVTSTGASDVATLTLSSGSVAQTTGTPTITDGDGNDFEGETLPTLARVYAFMFNAGTVVSSITSTFSALNGAIDKSFTTDELVLQVAPSGITAPLGTLALSFGASGGDITVTVVGKSS